MMRSTTLLFVLLSMALGSLHAFVPSLFGRPTTLSTASRHSGGSCSCWAKTAKEKREIEEYRKSLELIGKEDMPVIFTGGLLDNMDDKATQLASRLRSVKDLGWTLPPKPQGSIRPRHRAYGGETERPIQDKPNYDETNPKCVEKWLTQDDFYEFVKDSSPAADTVFCALAGGTAHAERHVVEQKLTLWRRDAAAAASGKFDEAVFLKSVQQGRLELIAGWAVFVLCNAIFVACLVNPTNPLALALYDSVQFVKDAAAGVGARS